MVRGSGTGRLGPTGQQRVQWKLSYNDDISYDTEATEVSATSGMRDMQGNQAVMAGQRAARLRSSNVELGWDKLPEAEFPSFLSESKSSYTKLLAGERQPNALSSSRRKELQESRIDLSVGCDKSGKHWQTDQSDTMSSHAEAKYACQRVAGFNNRSNYTSQVPLGYLRPDEVDADATAMHYQTSHQMQYMKPCGEEMTRSLSGTLGQCNASRALRASSFDIGNGMGRTGTDWQSNSADEMNRVARTAHMVNGVGHPGQKSKNAEMSQALRQSTIVLGEDPVDYNTSARGQVFKSASTSGLRGALGRLGQSVTMSGTAY